MDIKLAHALTVLCMFGSCFIACILPSVIHVHAEPHSRKKRILGALKRYCNCLSGGVFAGAFFTQFYPSVVNEFAALLPEKSIWRHPMQLGPTVVFMGFVLTALLERLMDVILTKLRHQKKLADGSASGAQELNSVVDGPLITTEAVGSDDEDVSFDTDPLSPTRNGGRTTAVKTQHRHQHSHGSSGSSGHNHGHHHHHHHIVLDEYQGASRFVVLVASLGTHSVFEGLALGLTKEVGRLFNMFLAIVVHEILMALALGISLSHQKMKLRSKIVFCLVFSIIIPFGQVIGILIQQSPDDSQSAKTVMAVLQAVAAGTFLHVMFMEILPQEMADHFGLLEAFWVVLGYMLIPFTSLATGGDHGG